MLFDEWLTTVGEGVAGYVTPKVAVAAVVGNDGGRDPPHPAGRLRGLALPGRLGRRRVLAVGGRDQGGLRGDRDRGRAGVAHRGVRRPAPRVRARRSTRWCSTAGCSAASCRATRSRPARSASSPGRAAVAARRRGALGRPRVRGDRRRPAPPTPDTPRISQPVARCTGTTLTRRPLERARVCSSWSARSCTIDADPSPLPTGHRWPGTTRPQRSGRCRGAGSRGRRASPARGRRRTRGSTRGRPRARRAGGSRRRAASAPGGGPFEELGDDLLPEVVVRQAGGLGERPDVGADAIPG